MPDAIVLLSGGLDSTTALAWALEGGYTPRCLSFDYGQRHIAELDAACAVAAHYQVPHLVITISERALQGSALTGDSPVPRDRDEALMAKEIPSTYVPARNTVLLALALSQAEAHGIATIIIGVNALDYSGYIDCRPEYIDAFNQFARFATNDGVNGRPVRVLAPLVHLSKADIIRLGDKLGAPYQLTHSCYDPVLEDYLAPSPRWWSCGRCDSCILRRKGFEAAGVLDPTRYIQAMSA